jgi:tryptophan-rich sensory protein
VFSPPGDWYGALAKSEWNPPSLIFGPVWMPLNLLMAVAVAALHCATGAQCRMAARFWGLRSCCMPRYAGFFLSCNGYFCPASALPLL